jgi:hypothetical protein
MVIASTEINFVVNFKPAANALKGALWLKKVVLIKI